MDCGNPGAKEKYTNTAEKRKAKTTARIVTGSGDRRELHKWNGLWFSADLPCSYGIEGPEETRLSPPQEDPEQMARREEVRHVQVPSGLLLPGRRAGIHHDQLDRGRDQLLYGRRSLSELDQMSS